MQRFITVQNRGFFSVRETGIAPVLGSRSALVAMSSSSWCHRFFADLVVIWP
jgi:hypothetical protein